MNHQIKHRLTGAVLFECEVPEDIASGMRTRWLLEKAAKERTYLGGADLRDADLRDAHLGDAYLGGADLRGADLRGADLGDAYLGGADLRGADLRGADLGGADLGGADLGGADLGDADLGGADLRGADRATDEQAIANLDKVREIVLDNQARLDMGHWHADESNWRDHTCAEEMLCDTTHCMAGWLQVCSTDPKIRAMDPWLAGVLQAPVAAKMFYRDNDEALEWLRDRKYVTEIEEGNKRAAERKARREAEGAQ